MTISSNVVFDLDGVLVNFLPVFKHFYESIHQENFNIDLVDQHNLSSFVTISQKQIRHLFGICFQYWESFQIYPGATEILAKLYEKTGEPPVILTARQYSSATPTYKLVERVAKKTPFQLIFKSPNAHKADYLKNKYDHIVEDRRKTVLELFEMGFDPILVKKSYNKFNSNGNIWKIEGIHELIPRIDSLVINVEL